MIYTCLRYEKKICMLTCCFCTCFSLLKFLNFRAQTNLYIFILNVGHKHIESSIQQMQDPGLVVQKVEISGHTAVGGF